MVVEGEATAVAMIVRAVVTAKAEEQTARIAKPGLGTRAVGTPATTGTGITATGTTITPT